MPSQNTRRSASTIEPYDPKQRIVGGIVLFLLMLILYFFLKLLLGMSSPPEHSFNLPKALPDEIVEEQAMGIAEGNEGNESNIMLSMSAETASYKSSRAIPAGFVFLDINGSPMQPEVLTSGGMANEINVPAYEAGWYVQAASFKEESRAQKLIQRIQDAGIVENANFVKVGDWYVVRLPPQSSEDAAHEQRRELRRKLRVRGQVKEIQ